MMKKFKFNFKLTKHQLIAEICLSGIFLALLLASRAIFKYIDIANGYSPQVQMLFFAFSLILLRTFHFRIGFCLIAPFTTMVFGISGHVFFDYLLPYWGFSLFMFYTPFIRSLKIESIKILIRINIVLGLTLILIGHAVMLISYFLSGIIFYNVTPTTSMSVNGPVVLISLIINVPVTIASIYPIYLLSKKIDHKIYY